MKLGRSEALTLHELNAKFVSIIKQSSAVRCVDSMEKADGVWIPCPNPQCIQDYMSGKIAQHTYTLFFGGRDIPPKAKVFTRWTASGSSLDDLCLLELIRGKCGMRFTVRNGEILSTCLH